MLCCDIFVIELHLGEILYFNEYSPRSLHTNNYIRPQGTPEYNNYVDINMFAVGLVSCFTVLLLCNQVTMLTYKSDKLFETTKKHCFFNAMTLKNSVSKSLTVQFSFFSKTQPTLEHEKEMI